VDEVVTVLEAVGDYLAANGHGTLGTDLFLGRMPETPDLCRAVYEYEGAPPVETMGAAATAVDKPRIQVLCRGGRDDYPAARDEAQEIRALLGAVASVTLSGIVVLRIRPLGSVNSLGPDGNDRPLVTVNFEAFVLP
jgi:Bacteriophage minor capsid protein